MKKIRLLWVNEEASFVGGCERYVHNTATALKEKGITSYLFYDVLCKEVDPTMTAPFEGAFPMVDLHRQVTELNPDLVYVHRLTGISPIQALAKCNVPVVRFFHDHKLFCPREHKYRPVTYQTCTQPIGTGCYTCPGFINRSNRWPGLTLTTVNSLKKEIYANQALTAFVTGSKYMARHISLHGFDSEQIHAIPLYSLPAEQLPEIKRDTDHLLFVGQLIRGKGLDVLLRAFVLVKNESLRLTVVGTGRQEQELRKLTITLGLEDRVCFAGKMNSTELSSFYCQATVVVVPSRSPETFGLIGPEAMRFGVPIIASDVGGMGEWLKNNETGFLVPPNDPPALAKAIDKLFADHKCLERFGKKAKERFENFFLPEYHVDKILELFKALIKRETVKGSSWGNFTQRGFPLVEAQLTRLAHSVREASKKTLKPDEYHALVAIGGYGRGEGGVIRSASGTERPHNNLDLLLITRSRSSQKLGQIKKRLQRAYEHLIEEYHIEIDVSTVPLSTLRHAPSLVMWYDMFLGHKTILGDAGLIPSLKKFRVERIPAWDIRNLLVNRGTLLVINDQIISEGQIDKKMGKVITPLFSPKKRKNANAEALAKERRGHF